MPSNLTAQWVAKGLLRRRPELNRGEGICSPAPNHSATPPLLYQLHCNKKAGPGSGAGDLERTTGFEPATPTLARSCSTTEPRPHCVACAILLACLKALQPTWNCCSAPRRAESTLPARALRQLGHLAQLGLLDLLDDELRDPLPPS